MTEATPDRHRIEAELAQLCDGVLRRSPSLGRLLRHLVARALDGDDDALTETAIASAVFLRTPGDYAPHLDPIVRVAMSRLRARLAAWYRTARPSSTGVRIHLPTGGYAPAFVAVVQARAGGARGHAAGNALH